MTKHAGFSEQSLRQAIVNTWGPAGAHVDVFDHMLAEITRLEAERDKWLDQLDDEVVRANTAVIEVATLRKALAVVMCETGTSSLAHHAARDALFPATPTATEDDCNCALGSSHGCPVHDAANAPTATAREGGSDGETT